MKKYYLFILIAFLTNCANNSEKTSAELFEEENVRTNTAENANNEEIQMSEDFQNLSLDGTLNGKYPIFMSLDKVGVSIYGEMLYKKIGLPISISGSESNGEWTLTERGENDEITGVYEGVVKENIFKGIWTNPKNEKSMPFELSVSDESIDLYKKKVVNDKDIVIARKYSDGISSFTFEKVSETEYLFSFFGTWAYGEVEHTGELEDVAILKNGKLYYHGSEENYTENCSFTAVFKGEKMFIETESNGSDCGFGANVSLGTEYTKE